MCGPPLLMAGPSGILAVTGVNIRTFGCYNGGIGLSWQHTREGGFPAH